jgi:hypothetical protein
LSRELRRRTPQGGAVRRRTWNFEEGNVAVSGKRVFWGILKTIGMALVILDAVYSIQRISTAASIASSLPDVNLKGATPIVITINVVLIIWAWLVIWRPIRPRR